MVRENSLIYTSAYLGSLHLFLYVLEIVFPMHGRAAQVRPSQGETYQAGPRVWYTAITFPVVTSRNQAVTVLAATTLDNRRSLGVEGVAPTGPLECQILASIDSSPLGLTADLMLLFFERLAS